ncbi:hypothetical protein M9Y10_013106 [Tritrichomonas musculus]|uniref:Uncharacterized protein n=1 Tax=Tritrichomonas musculus TaxID=1915356 RepID=A0ABR2I6G1_9EUKA
MQKTNNNSISLETLDYSIEDGCLKMINKDCTDILKKEKIQYQKDFKVSVNPKKDTVFVKKGNEQVYLQIVNKLLNINATLPTFKKFMKNANITQQKTLPSFNPEKLSNYYQRISNREYIDFPDPLEADKIFQESDMETPKKLSTSFSEEFSFSDASNDFSNNVEPLNAYKKTKSSPFGLSIYMTPREHSEKTIPVPASSLTPQISLATCYDDDSSSSSANSSSSMTNNNSIINTTLYIDQPQTYHTSIVSSPAPIPTVQSTLAYQQQMQIQIQQQTPYIMPTSNLPTFKPSIKKPEHTKLNIQYKKKEASSAYKIVGDEAKIQKIRSVISKFLCFPPNTEIQKILFVS